MCDLVITGSEFWPAWLRGVQCHISRGVYLMKVRKFTSLTLIKLGRIYHRDRKNMGDRALSTVLFFPAAISYFLEVPATVRELLNRVKIFCLFYTVQ